MQFKQLKIEVPNLFLSKKINDQTLQGLLDADSHPSVIERFYRLANDVKDNYIWAELDCDTGFSLTATLTPKYVLIGEAKAQAQDILNLNTKPVYVVNFKLVDLYTNQDHFNMISNVYRAEDVANTIAENLAALSEFQEFEKNIENNLC